MPKYLLKAFTGPCWIEETADKLRLAGVDVTCVGTEHIYALGEGMSPDGAAWDVGVDVFRKHGTDMGLKWKPVSLTGEPAVESEVHRGVRQS
jgi:hypothetical protein